MFPAHIQLTASVKQHDCEMSEDGLTMFIHSLHLSEIICMTIACVNTAGGRLYVVPNRFMYTYLHTYNIYIYSIHII